MVTIQVPKSEISGIGFTVDAEAMDEVIRALQDELTATLKKAIQLEQALALATTKRLAQAAIAESELERNA